jgi:hypothetical protein
MRGGNIQASRWKKASPMKIVASAILITILLLLTSQETLAQSTSADFLANSAMQFRFLHSFLLLPILKKLLRPSEDGRSRVANEPSRTFAKSLGASRGGGSDCPGSTGKVMRRASPEWVREIENAFQASRQTGSETRHRSDGPNPFGTIAGVTRVTCG